MTIGLLGPLTVEGHEVALGHRDRVVLAALAVRAGETVSAERLADALWGEAPPASSGKVVQGCVVRLRKALGTSSIETTAHGYRLTLPCDRVDTHRFERLVRRGQELLALDEPERAAYAIDEALALWRGPALIDLQEWPPGSTAAIRLEELRRDAEECRLDAALRAGQYREVLAQAEARVAEEPLRERRWALLALAQYQAGRQADALRTLHRARRLLAEETGLDPGPELVALEKSILCQDESLVATSLVTASTSCPYLGLVPYGVEDADAFFGRDADVARCIRALHAHGALTVVGPSGSGKSSLVRAGVVASLRRSGQRVTVLTPGARPMEALTDAATSGRFDVLVVDQCEEAASACADAAARAAFLAAVADHAERAPVIVALRADRLGELTAHVEFARLVERSLVLLGVPGEDDLRAMVEGPARQAGLLVEPGLIDLLVREVEGEPGALPLLSHALRTTWERREARTLTVAGYRASGGVRGAVAQSAEQLYEDMSPQQRPLLRDLMLRLVSPTADGEPVRSRVPRRSVVTDVEHEELVERLVAARLVTSDDGVVELAHEALARAWPRFRGWLEDDVEGQRIRRHVSSAAEAWEAMGRPASELYRGARLEQAIEWRDVTAPELNPAERSFLDAGRDAAHSDRRAQARANRRLRALVVAIGASLVVALVAGGLAVRQARRADREAVAAEREAARADDAAAQARQDAARADDAAAQARQEAARADDAAVAADARRVGAQALVSDDIDESLLLAVEAVRLDDSPDTRASLLATLTRHPALVAAARSDQPLLTVDASSELVAVGDPFVGVAFHDARTLAPVGRFDDPPWRLAFDPNGREVAMAANPYDPLGQQLDPVPLLLVDAGTFELSTSQLGGQPDQAASVSGLDYSDDGTALAVEFDLYTDDPDVATGTTIAVWHLATPDRPVRTIARGPGAGGWIGLSPDGARLYAGAEGGEALAVYDVVTGTELATSPVANVAGSVSPAGDAIAVADGRDVVLLDAGTLGSARRMEGPATVTTLSFAHDGARVGVGYDDGTAVVWDVASGAVSDRFDGHTGVVGEMAFSPDDATLYTVSLDRSLLAWDLRGDRRFVSLRSTPQPPAGPDYPIVAASGRLVTYVGGLSGGPDAMQFHDLATGQLSPLVEVGHGGIADVRVRPPSFDEVATSGRDHVVRIWDRQRGALLRQRDIGAASISYTGDGRHLVTGDDSGEIVRIDAETLQTVGPEVHLGHGVVRIRQGADDRTVVVITDEPGLAVVDVVDGTVISTTRTDVAPIATTYSPDGERVAVAMDTGEVGVLDAASGTWVRPPLVGHRNTVISVDFSPDGNMLVSAGLDGRVSLWDGRTGALLGTVLPRRPDVATAVGFAADGYTAVIASTDGTIATWDTRLDQWVDVACAVAGRDLTAAEWREAFPDRAYRETCP